MTVREMSDSFDTLLNSYASKAVFGDQAGDTEIVLDEYEKSVLLTQAQDNVIKSYFEKHTNELLQGFDDSSRRQVDFSSLIKVAELTPSDSSKRFDNRGIIYKLPTVPADDGGEYSRVLYILNETLIGYTGSSSTNFIIGEGVTADTRMTLHFENTTNNILQITINSDNSEAMIGACSAHYKEATDHEYAQLIVTVGHNASPTATTTGVLDTIKAELADTAHETMATTAGKITVQGTPAITRYKRASYTLMGTNFTANGQNEIRYVIVPINYKEYDREMSKPYANPLKKQAWRLFQNIADGYDIYSELIPIWNVDTGNLTYKIRYVERPYPIVLVDLPNGLSIDGYDKQHGCDLNPIIHPEIMKEAVRLAIESRASAVARAEAYRNAEQRQNR